MKIAPHLGGRRRPRPPLETQTANVWYTFAAAVAASDLATKPLKIMRYKPYDF